MINHAAIILINIFLSNLYGYPVTFSVKIDPTTLPIKQCEVLTGNPNKDAINTAPAAPIYVENDFIGSNSVIELPTVFTTL